MASIIKLKRNTNASEVPSDGALQQGELAINLADKKLFSSSDGTDIIQISGDAYSVGTVTDTDGATIKLTGTGNAANTQVVLTGANGIGITSNDSGAITITANTVDVDFVTSANATSANLSVASGANTDIIKIVGDDHIVVAGTNTSHVSVKLTNAVSVASVQTSGNTVVGGDADISGEVNAATAAITTSLQVGATNGPAANATTFTVGTAGGLITIGNNNVTVGNSTVNTSITSTALHSDVAVDLDSTLNVSGDITAGADVDITGEVNAASAAIGGATISSSADVGARNLILSGNLTVQGTTTEVSSVTVTIDDPMLSLADNQADSSSFTDAVDVGFYGVAGNTSSKFFYGIARDQSANTFVVYNGVDNEPGTTVDFTGGGIAQLDAIIDGGTY
jgi:fibronectin-binding autotransporter adhesin